METLTWQCSAVDLTVDKLDAIAMLVVRELLDLVASKEDGVVHGHEQYRVEVVVVVAHRPHVLDDFVLKTRGGV